MQPRTQEEAGDQMQTAEIAEPAKMFSLCDLGVLRG
jgi:hypothetical protein